MKFITYIFLTILSLIIFSCKTNKNVRFYRDLSAEIITKTDNNRKVIQKNDITKVISKDSFSVKILRIKEDFTFNNFSLDTVHDFFNNSKIIKYKQLQKNCFEILVENTLFQFEIKRNNNKQHKEIYRKFINSILLLNYKDYKPDSNLISAFFDNNKLLYFDTFLNKMALV